MTNPELANDPAAFLQHLDDQLDALIRLEAALDAAEPGAATDETGAVTVEFSPEGQLTSISVAPTWEQQIKAEELPTVISDTLVRARDGAGEPVETDSGLSDEEVAAIRERELEEMRQTLFAPQSDEELEEIAKNLPSQFDELNASIEAMLAKAGDAEIEVSEDELEVPGEEYHSENGMVAVKVANGAVVGVSFHESWLPGKSGNVITQCFNEIIQELPGTAAPLDQ